MLLLLTADRHYRSDTTLSRDPIIQNSVKEESITADEIMNHYKYDGPVMMFGRCIFDHFRSETWANSEKKALSNLAYQYKVKANLSTDAKIKLEPKKLVLKREGDQNE